jgi:D-alanyl-D-alanine carboxypeptidase
MPANMLSSLPMHFLRTVAVLCLLVSVEARADDIDRYVQSQLKRQHIPGLSLAVIQKGRIVKLRGYGFADLERNVPVTPATVFEIGSITKQFTAFAMMLLVEQEKIGLDVSIDQYLAEIPEVWKPVTIRQLLTHTSGIADYEEIMGYGAYRNPMTATQVISLAAGKPLDFAPGTKWNYSNTGYFLLTLIVEKVSAEPYSQFVRRHVLEAVGMNHTRSSDPFEIIRNRSAGYAYANGRLENRDPIQPTATGGAGMLVSTVGDLAKWDAALTRQAILTNESYVQVWNNAPLSSGLPSGYGLGWFVSPMRDHRSQSHSGGTAGFSSNILRLPDDQLTVIVLTNSYNANPVSIANHIARVFIPGLAYAPIPPRDPEIGNLVMNYYVHRADPEVYEEPLSAEFSAKMRNYWRENLDYYKSLGPPQAAVLVERREVGPGRQYRYRVRYAEVSRLVLVTIDASGKIADLETEEE